MKRDFININLSTQYLDDDDQWQDVTITCRACRNPYHNPITEPYEPFLDIEDFQCLEFDWIDCGPFEEEITKAFYRAEFDGLNYWEDTQSEKIQPQTVLEMAA